MEKGNAVDRMFEEFVHEPERQRREAKALRAQKRRERLAEVLPDKIVRRLKLNSK